MHGGGDDVVGRFFAQLHDELAKIGFPDLNARLLQNWAELDFFRDHGFRLHHRAHTEPGGEVLHIGASFFAIGRPENMSAARDHFFFELEKVAIEMIDSFPLDLLALLASSLPVLDARAPLEVCHIVAVHAAPDDFAVHQVRRLHGCVLQKALCGSLAHGLPCAELFCAKPSCARMLAR